MNRHVQPFEQAAAPNAPGYYRQVPHRCPVEGCPNAVYSYLPDEVRFGKPMWLRCDDHVPEIE